MYRKYKVEKDSLTDLYIIRPHKLYNDSYQFNRIIKFDNGIQTSAITFYGWIIIAVFDIPNGYMVALNSLPVRVGCNKSTYTCKTVLMDESLRIINEREFKYKEQKDEYYAYSYFDTIFEKNSKRIFFRVINSGFDTDDYYEYQGEINYDNKVTSSLKKHIFRK